MTMLKSAERLLEAIGSCDSCIVAFSGGVDSAVVAKAAHIALGEKAIAATGSSPSLASGELEIAKEVAALICIAHEVISTSEGSSPAYQANGFDRCFHCKDDLYTHLHRLRERIGAEVIFNGANADDLSDFRPGMKAADTHAVRSPLAECGLGKQAVRELARFWGLPVADKPAMPCLASRIAYGEEVTPERMAMIDLAEQFLRELGIKECRVRYHRGDLARIEVPSPALPMLCEPNVRKNMLDRFKEIGFRFVTIDLEGFRSGSLNLLAPEELLRGIR